MDGIDISWQEGEPSYQSYLLRCWQEEDIGSGGEPQDSPDWRFALVRLHDDRQKKGFACLEELVAFFQSEFGKIGV